MAIPRVHSQLANNQDTVSFSYCGFGTWELFIPNSNGLSSCSLDVPQKNSHLEGIPVYPKFKHNQVGYSWLYDVVYPIKIPLNANVNFNHNRMDNPHYSNYIPIFPRSIPIFHVKTSWKILLSLTYIFLKKKKKTYPQYIHNDLPNYRWSSHEIHMINPHENPHVLMLLLARHRFARGVSPVLEAHSREIHRWRTWGLGWRENLQRKPGGYADMPYLHLSIHGDKTFNGLV